MYSNWFLLNLMLMNIFNNKPIVVKFATLVFWGLVNGNHISSINQWWCLALILSVSLCFLRLCAVCPCRWKVAWLCVGAGSEGGASTSPGCWLVVPALDISSWPTYSRSTCWSSCASLVPCSEVMLETGQLKVRTQSWSQHEALQLEAKTLLVIVAREWMLTLMSPAQSMMLIWWAPRVMMLCLLLSLTSKSELKILFSS